MLTKDIRKTIDNARDVLVGKIPNPQAQIEQITIAMIYKFMDDMDLESVEFGGERQFFTDELEKYAWSKLMSTQNDVNSRMNLYSEALDKLPLSNQIPKLFRDIFKGAYLPFRDGQTLTLFLKEISDLTYDNSENLGNAFEYLLSIMGSQGDAGQFRTPRHIIDFIVKVVNPTKNDTILDPACGTAGFLISAYKHILETAKQDYKILNPSELKTLTENLNGYDISPDMVKLALVNMYLHGFKEPKIYEYDTLTSLDRWDNYFDCILANPPFMTPKGGIKPHNKFSININRSEVLFVDYIIEHLNSNGKTGIIVPEGIVFQSANAYKELRKKLINENYLYAVVSLPSGVFQPYSAVKTSILLLDKQLAKKTDKILFIDIQNDGYTLGVQRRISDKNDLPEAIDIISNWKDHINNSSSLDFNTESKLVTVVEKLKIQENGEFNLTTSMYKNIDNNINTKWDLVKLSDLVTYHQGVQVDLKNQIKEFKEGYDRFLRIENYTQNSDDFRYIPAEYSRGRYVKKEDIVIVRYGASAGFVAKGLDGVLANNLFVLKNKDTNVLDNEYLYYVLISDKISSFIKEKAFGGCMPALNFKIMDMIMFPLPPIIKQKKFVLEIKSIIQEEEKAIEECKKLIEIHKQKINDKIQSIWGNE